jgi:uncharacterized protein (AIM24 family)
MDTVFGDGSGQPGRRPVRQAAGAGKRLVTGESLFTTVYTNNASAKQRVAFAAPYPGKILPMDLRQLGGTLICQKDAFLCAARGVSLGIAFQQKLSVGFFGGEGFIMQKLDGDGLAFVHAGGTVVKRELQPGQTLLVDTGCVVAYTPRTSTSRSSTSARSRRRCSAARACSLPSSPAPARCGCRACRSRAWRRACSPRRRSAAAGAKRAGLGGLLPAGGVLGGMLGGDDE